MRYLFILACALAGVTQAFAADGASSVNFGPILSDVVQWTFTAFGAALAAAAVTLIYRGLNYLGVKTTEAQKEQLQSIVTHGLNDAGAKAAATVGASPNLTISVQDKIIADAVAYVQRHGADTIKSLGLDPNSGEAVEAIKARIATAVADPRVPTPPQLGGSQPLASA